MKLSQFKFKLPEDRIAKYPVENRDESRLMVVHKKNGEIEHVMFKEILNYFDEKDVFVFNDTRVFPARLYGNKEKTGAQIEVFLLRELREENLLWDVQVDPARKIRIGNKLYFGEDNSMVAEVIDNTTSRGRVLRFLYDGPHDEFKKALYALGEAPIPTYLKRKACAWSYNENGEAVPVPMAERDPHDDTDDIRFQTIDEIAVNEGAVTAPTAGLHFSRELMKRMEIKGIDRAFITMHCGLGNFREIDVEDLTKHKMESEEMYVTEECTQIVNNAKLGGHKICAIGNTVNRALETVVGTDHLIKPFEGWTNKFIFPPYTFSVADSMVSNFQLPESIQLMLTCAYGGYDLIMSAYNLAVKKGYRFGCYGDAMLITD
ncbi:MAG: tRNA preQ1(34) S-adenosylmethionine ribosyltransferase-isomerase QueA [Bacteroidaceae bacterium]|nr:tRNA preQ1(34) S-adenosylmethionine ribosyltransferase-isomerase QueA [Bacteroidaceae bacterium]